MDTVQVLYKYTMMQWCIIYNLFSWLVTNLYIQIQILHIIYLTRKVIELICYYWYWVSIYHMICTGLHLVNVSSIRCHWFAHQTIAAFSIYAAFLNLLFTSRKCSSINMAVHMWMSCFLSGIIPLTWSWLFYILIQNSIVNRCTLYCNHGNNHYIRRLAE